MIATSTQLVICVRSQAKSLHFFYKNQMKKKPAVQTSNQERFWNRRATPYQTIIGSFMCFFWSYVNEIDTYPLEDLFFIPFLRGRTMWFSIHERIFKPNIFTVIQMCNLIFLSLAFKNFTEDIHCTIHFIGVCSKTNACHAFINIFMLNFYEADHDNYELELKSMQSSAIFA